MIFGNTVLTDAMAWKRVAEPLVRPPNPEDGPAVWQLIKATPSLDSNSLYCNLLQCTHFAQTCAIAERNGDVVGWASGHVLPKQPDTLFIWQVCVADAARGSGLAKRLILDVLARPARAQISRLQCTITQDNTASWALFGSLARDLGAQMEQVPCFRREQHFAETHESELGVSIGPFTQDRARALLD
ncbi:diaminobutyrate acetyltransferase [Devosia lucknowensis]|uniref:L-2,4-diaminobutyric acid acetyltransferase n=1 Tax=Devosia lucknowensis TaxID=1096929 RepID=A0A1Y6EGE0_9HYPH|nr:diaminobutyrate acetyltransferase [Devosia lucknowensis]SMQ60231.1 diaminobutyrate acetyltransferase [Devosia lucknowensis]